MARSFTSSVIFGVLKAPVLLFGALLAGIILDAHVQVLPLFLRPNHGNFWDDIIAYRLRSDDHLTLPQLYEKYPDSAVHDNAVLFQIAPGLVPSEKSALACWVAISLKADGDDPPQMDRAKYIWYALAWFPIVYAPVLLLISTLGRNYTWAICRSERAMYLFKEKYEATLGKRAMGFLLAVPPVLGLAYLNATGTLTPDFQRAGYEQLDLTIIFVLLSYMSGLGIRFIQEVISGVFISFGVDPEKTHWDEVLTVILTAPVLIFILDNSLLSVVSDQLAGLGSVVIAKLLRRRQTADTLVMDAVPVEEESVEPLIRSSVLAVVLAVVGFPLCCCGMCLTPARSYQQEPTDITLSELENPDPKRKPPPWIAVTDGELFWPALKQEVVGTWTDEGIGYSGKWYLVPLVSPEVRKEWEAIYKRDAEKAKYPYDKCRVIAAFTREEFARYFPTVKVEGKPEKISAPMVVRGTFIEFPSANKQAKETIKSDAVEFPEKQMLILRSDARPSGQFFFAFVLVVGVLTLCPPLIRLMIGWPRRVSDVLEPIPVRSRGARRQRNE